MRYDLTDYLKEGINHLAIEVATTLERQAYPLLDEYGKNAFKEPEADTGLTGSVKLYRKLG
jgi:hypothetical protein